MKYFFNFKNKKDCLYGFILFVVLSVLLVNFGDAFFKKLPPEEQEVLKQEILSEIDADTLCEDLFDTVYEKIDFYERKDIEEDFAEVNVYQKDIFIAQGMNQYMAEGGIGFYFYNTQCAFVNDLADTLDEFELYEFSNLWQSFMDNPDIDWDALIKEVRQYGVWDDETKLYESIYAKYPLKEFDEAFFVLNQDNLFTMKLDAYARANIDQYDYWRISESQFIQAPFGMEPKDRPLPYEDTDE